jgi:hypothetical protein
VRQIVAVLVVIATGLAIAAGSAFGLHDTETLVPPPEAVTEGFTRELVERRYGLALNYLARDLRATTDAASLRARMEPMRQRLGTPNQVSAVTYWVRESDAAARALVDADAGTAVLEFALIRENGLWRIARLPEATAMSLVR